jgi:hypothetical protein
LSKYLHPAEPQFVLLQTGTTTTTRTSTSTTTTTSGGGGRVLARAVLTSGADGYGAINLAYNPDKDEYLAVWVEDEGSSFAVYGRILDAEGVPATSAKEVSKSDVDCCNRIGLAYGGKDYLLSYTEADGNLAVRRVKSGTGSGLAKAVVIAPAGFGSAVAFDPDDNRYLVTYFDDSSASFLQVVSNKGKKSGNPVALPGASGSNQYQVNHVAYNATDQQVLTVGVEINGTKRRPVGLGFDDPLSHSAGPFVYSNKFVGNAINWVAAAFRDTGEGLVGWNAAAASSGQAFIRAIRSDGAPTGNAKRVGSGLPVNVFPVAENLAEQNLIVWTDLNAAAVSGQEANDSAGLIGSSFRISDTSEQVSSGFNAAAYSSISGESGVLYTRAGASPAVAFALLSQP